MDCPDDSEAVNEPDAGIILNVSNADYKIGEIRYHFMVGTCNTVTKIFGLDATECEDDDLIEYSKFNIMVNDSTQFF